MPNRAQQHIIGDRAVSAVRNVWATQGAAVEEIRRDYGEDLLVQTHLMGRMDGSRIWVQVKGTEQDLSNVNRKLPPVRVNCDLALRWARTSDLVAVVLWDTRNNVGWYATPQGALTQKDLIADLSGSTSIPISRELPFDQVAADRLCWTARVRLANIELQCALQSADDSQNVHDEDARYFRAEAGVILQGILLDLRILATPHEIDPQFRALIQKHAASDIVTGSAPLMARQATLLAVMETFNKNAAGCGVPISLLRNTAQTVSDFVFADLPGYADE